MLMHAGTCSIVPKCNDGKRYILLKDSWKRSKLGVPDGSAQLANESMFKDKVLLTFGTERWTKI